MSNQNVQNLVEYIRKNSSLSPMQLEEVVLKVGYSKEELNQALKIVGLPSQQNIITSSSDVSTAENSKQGNNIWLWAILGFLVILTFGGIAGLYFINKNDVNTKVVSPTPTPISEKPISPALSTQSPAAELQTNPMDAFFTTLSSADYKITTTGKIEYKKQEEGGSHSSSLDLNNGIIYLKKGSVVRGDKTDTEEPEIAIVKGNKIFSLNPVKKTYSAFDTADGLGKFYLMALQSSFPLMTLVEDTKKNKITWEKTGNNEWQTNWKWKTPLDTQETPVKVKISMSPATKLITTLSLRFDNSQSWQDVIFQYETVGDIENLLIVPADYKEEKLDF